MTNTKKPIGADVSRHALHVSLIQEQDDLSVGHARVVAYREGPDGLRSRLITDQDAKDAETYDRPPSAAK